MRRRHHLLSGSLKIKYIKSIRRLLDSALLKRFGDRWNGRQQGTGCDELQKCATIGHETSGEQNAFEEWRFINPKAGEEQGKFQSSWKDDRSQAVTGVFDGLRWPRPPLRFQCLCPEWRVFRTLLTCVTSTLVAILSSLGFHCTVISDPSLPIRLPTSLLLILPGFAKLVCA